MNTVNIPELQIEYIGCDITFFSISNATAYSPGLWASLLFILLLASPQPAHTWQTTRGTRGQRAASVATLKTPKNDINQAWCSNCTSPILIALALAALNAQLRRQAVGTTKSINHHKKNNNITWYSILGL